MGRSRSHPAGSGLCLRVHRVWRVLGCSNRRSLGDPERGFGWGAAAAVVVLVGFRRLPGGPSATSALSHLLVLLTFPSDASCSLQAGTRVRPQDHPLCPPSPCPVLPLKSGVRPSPPRDFPQRAPPPWGSGPPRSPLVGPKAQTLPWGLRALAFRSHVCKAAPTLSTLLGGPLCGGVWRPAPPSRGHPAWLPRWDSCACWGDRGWGELTPGSVPREQLCPGLQLPLLALGSRTPALTPGRASTHQESCPIIPRVWRWPQAGFRSPVLGAAGATQHQLVRAPARLSRGGVLGGSASPEAAGLSSSCLSLCPPAPPSSLLVAMGAGRPGEGLPAGALLRAPLLRARVDMCGLCSRGC